MEEKNKLKRRIESGEARVGVIGMGYVGLPLAINFARAGFPVTGFDSDPAKVEALNERRSYIRHIPGPELEALGDAFSATSKMSLLGEMDVVVICVPTPLTRNREPDTSYIEKSAREIAAVLRPGMMVSLESTTYPGTTDELLLPPMEGTGLRVGRDFFLVYSPEREDPGNSRFSMGEIPKVVGGVTDDCREMGELFYGRVVRRVVPVSSTRVAEATKLLENIYRSVNIALVNELKVLFTRMGIDVWEVIEASKTKPFGFNAFYPGPGLGGHCIPIDPFYLTWKARQYDLPTRFVELAGEINVSMPYYVVERLAGGLNDQGKALKGARLLLLGVAYKKDVDDVRESPALKIIQLLRANGAVVGYHDPFVSRLGHFRHGDFDLESRPLNAELLRETDAVIVLVDHGGVDYGLVAEHAPLIVDTRNVYPGTGNPKIIKA